MGNIPITRFLFHSLSLFLLLQTILFQLSTGEISSDTKFRPCEGKPADVVFALDTSNSIWPGDFVKQLAFVKDVTGVFMLGRDNTQVGVFTYADRVKLQFNLDRHHNKDDLDKAIEVIKQDGGYVTRTADAIRYMRERAFKEERGARSHVTKVGIVITDGLSHNTTETRIEADKNREAGIHMFSVGVGSRTDRRELSAIANKPTSYYMFQVDSFNRLGSIKDLLAIKACQVTDPPTTLSPTAAYPHVRINGGDGGPYDPARGDNIQALRGRDTSHLPSSAERGVDGETLGARLWRFSPQGRLAEAGRDITQNDGEYLKRLARATDTYVDDDIIWGLDEAKRRIKVGCVFNGTHYIGYWVKDEEGKDLWYGFPVDGQSGGAGGAGRVGDRRPGGWIDGAARQGADERGRDRERDGDRFGRLTQDPHLSGRGRDVNPDWSAGRDEQGNQIRDPRRDSSDLNRRDRPQSSDSSIRRDDHSNRASDWSRENDRRQDLNNGRGDHYNGRGDQYNGHGDQYNGRGDQYNGRGDQYNGRGDQYDGRGDESRRHGDQSGRRGFPNADQNNGRGDSHGDRGNRDSNGRQDDPRNDRSDSYDRRGGQNSGRGDPNSGRGDPNSGRGDQYGGRGDSSGRDDPYSGRGDQYNGRGDPNSGRGDQYNGRGDQYNGRGDLNGGRGDSYDRRGVPVGRGDSRGKYPGQASESLSEAVPMVDGQGRPGRWNRTENGKQVWMEYVCPGEYKPVDKPPEAIINGEGTRQALHHLGGKDVTYVYPDQGAGNPNQGAALNEITECTVTEEDGKQSVYRYVGPGRFKKVGHLGRPHVSQEPRRLSGEGEGNQGLEMGGQVRYMNGDRGRMGRAGCIPPHPLDLIFIVDSRTHPQRRATNLWRVVRDVISHVDTVDQWVRVRFVQDWQRDSFDSLARGPFVNKDDLLKAVQSALDHVPMTSGELIGSMASMFNKNDEENRAGKGGRVAVLVSDGEVSDPGRAQGEADRARQYLGVHVMAVGVGAKADENGLRSLVSEPKSENYLSVTDQANHRTVAQNIANKLCNV